MASYCVFGMLGAALFGVGVNFAIERGSGWLEVKQASPMPPPALLLAKTASSAGFALVVTILLIVIGRFAGNVHLTAPETSSCSPWSSSAPSPSAHSASSSACSLPPTPRLDWSISSFCRWPFAPASGSRSHSCPTGSANRAFLPSYHLAQLPSAPSASPWITFPPRPLELALAGFTLLFLGIGWIAFRYANLKS